jgi:hypothetical protein
MASPELQRDGYVASRQFVSVTSRPFRNMAHSLHDCVTLILHVNLICVPLEFAHFSSLTLNRETSGGSQRPTSTRKNLLQNFRKFWNQWEFYLLFNIYIICSICSPRQSTHFLSRFTTLVRILLNILGLTVAQPSVIICLR